MTKHFCDSCNIELNNDRPASSQLELDRSVQDKVKVHVQIEPDRYGEICELCRNAFAIAGLKVILNALEESAVKMLPAERM